MEKVVRIYNSFEEQEKAEIARRNAMSVQERFHEFAVIQERVWGEAWTETPIVRKVTFEYLDQDVK